MARMYPLQRPFAPGDRIIYIVREAFDALGQATVNLAVATCEWDEARKKYLATDPCATDEASPE